MVEDACAYWRCQLDAVTNGDLRSWGHVLFSELLRTPDEDYAVLADFNLLGEELDRLDGIGSCLLKHAFELDPSGRDELCSAANSLSSYISNIANSAGELIILRRDSLRTLVDSERSRSLICQTF